MLLRHGNNRGKTIQGTGLHRILIHPVAINGVLLSE
jgi:hypothetical protein